MTNARCWRARPTTVCSVSTFETGSVGSSSRTTSCTTPARPVASRSAYHVPHCRNDARAHLVVTRVPHDLRVVRHRRRVDVESNLVDVVHDPDDPVPAVAVHGRHPAGSDPLPERIPFRPGLACERTGHDDGAFSAFLPEQVEVSSFDEIDAHGVEVARCDLLPSEHPRQVEVGQRPPLETMVRGAWKKGQWDGVRCRCSHDAGQPAQAIEQCALEAEPTNRVVRALGERYGKGQRIDGVETGFDGHKLLEGPRRKPRSYQQHEGERNLRRDQPASRTQPFASVGGAARARSQAGRCRDRRRAPGGKQPEQ